MLIVQYRAKNMIYLGLVKSQFINTAKLITGRLFIRTAKKDWWQKYMFSMQNVFLHVGMKFRHFTKRNFASICSIYVLIFWHVISNLIYS